MKTPKEIEYNIAIAVTSDSCNIAQGCNIGMPVNFFDPTTWGQISSEKSGKRAFYQARRAIKNKNKGQENRKLYIIPCNTML